MPAQVAGLTDHRWTPEAVEHNGTAILFTQTTGMPLAYFVDYGRWFSFYVYTFEACLNIITSGRTREVPSRR